MFKDNATQKLIEYIQTFPREERKLIAREILEPSEKKKNATKQKVLKDIKAGLLEIKESKRTGKKMKSLDEFLNEF
ncbi:MAG: hypothetical protein JST83_02070 [Bacteroidetes bacterium]|nr:hypothetical protein [Bacteroidota bacterium]